MKLLILIPVLMILNLNTDSVKNKTEFEGVISYNVELELKNKNLNKEAIEDYFGRKKKYYFKNGKYKWITQNANLEYELYNYDIDKDHSISKTSNSDTLYFKDFTNSSDYVSNVDSVNVERICGILCQGLEFSVSNAENTTMMRTLYFPIDSLIYSKEYYAKQIAMGNNTIHSYGNSIPLKLVLDSETIPFKITYTATKIKAMKIKDNQFQIKKNAPIKYP